MPLTTILAIIAAFVLGIVLTFLFTRRKKPEGDGMSLILQQLNELTRTVDQKISETHRQVHDIMRYHSSESSKLIKEITEELTKVSEGQKQVISFADQLQNLQDILKNPKQRGILGEYYLETILQNILPPGAYQMQYGFADGTIVDAVIFAKEKIIPIDSKFSLENYNRLIEAKDPTERDRLEKIFVNDLKTRIAETAKYIRPQEGTTDFSFMFIPHEAIYYDLLINKIGEKENLIEQAARKSKVIIISPTTFLAYLQTVLQGLKSPEIEEKAKDIIKRISELGRHLKSYEEYQIKLGNALNTVVNHYNAASREFKKIDKDIFRLTGSSVSFEPISLEKPNEPFS